MGANPDSNCGHDMPTTAIGVPDVELPGDACGSQDNPYIVSWKGDEREDPYNWSPRRKWLFTFVTASAALSVSFASSGYTGALPYLVKGFDISRNVAMLGLTLYVLGFAAGPLAWAPLSEVYGRRPVFLISQFPFVMFCLGAALARNITTLLVTRFLSGLFGGSMMVVSGGMVADVWRAGERGLATSIFVLACFLGPVIAPIASGFLGKSVFGWRSVFYAMFFFAATTYGLGIAFLPETYGPVLLQRRAKDLQQASAAARDSLSHYRSVHNVTGKTARQVLKTSLSRPFILLFLEPIVVLLSIWVAFVYGTLYLFFSAYPLVFQSPRPQGYGWDSAIGALPFLGIGAGMVVGTLVSFITDKRYVKRMDATSSTKAPPEARLPPACFGAVCLPISLAIFAATSDPRIHWIAPTLAGVPFGLGLILIFVSVLSYLIDTFTIYAASALAANSVLRCLFAAVFPLFATKMYQSMGYRWASGVVAFFALACMPMPFIFHRYGAAIRKRSRFASKPGEVQPSAAVAEAGLGSPTRLMTSSAQGQGVSTGTDEETVAETSDTSRMAPATRCDHHDYSPHLSGSKNIVLIGASDNEGIYGKRQGSL